MTGPGGVPFLKGHGTENDFVLLPDLDDRLVLTPALTTALCDRRAGIGGDGVLRVVPATAASVDVGLDVGAAQWFMDYRNSDGSVSEMCGNGARLFARYLLDAGLEGGPEFDIATRGGPRQVRVAPPDDRGDGEVCIDMGPAVPGPESATSIGGHDLTGTTVHVPNPHLVCLLDDDGPVRLRDLDLATAPPVDPAVFPDGANVEFVEYVSKGDDRLHVAMRVHERGAGETRSCGTGACAVAATALRRLGRASGDVLVDVPGGQVRVTVSPETTVLCGPAVFVAAGELDPAWLAAVARGRG